MFTVPQLRESLADPALAADLQEVRRALARRRIGTEATVSEEAASRLTNLVSAVLSSATKWPAGEATDVLERAGEAAELLALQPNAAVDRTRLRAALLYELAAMPMMAAAVYKGSAGPRFLDDFFTREHAFGSLASDIVLNGDMDEASPATLLRHAACEDALALVELEHASTDELESHPSALRTAARHLALDMSLTDVDAFVEVVKRRATRATRFLTPPNIGDTLRGIGFPPELWEGQAQALRAGMLDHQHDAWGLAAPTGTGKTFLARLLVVDALARHPGSKVLYIVPTKALVQQVYRDLAKALSPLGTGVVAVKPQLTQLDEEDESDIQDASVLVLTPEKADLLLRIGAEFLNEVSLVVVDEAHHIEDGTRGVLLELYLVRLRDALAAHARYVLLSAVAPNIRDLTDWIGSNTGFAVVDQRSTRMKVGTYRVRKEGRYNRGFIDYTDGTQLRLFESGVKTGQRAGLVQLTQRLAAAGPILVVAQGKKTTENIARELRAALIDADRTALSEEALRAPAVARLDSRLEREMYAEVELRALVRFGIAYHHAGLPPRVREAVEAAIAEGHIKYVIATTTLADGVNFPFSTVIVQSLAVQAPTFEAGKPMSWRIFTPRKFWNIAGRAGRPGSDHEGQVILYEPSLRVDRVESIDPYVNPAIRDIPPVTSALADGIRGLRQQVARGEVSLRDLGAEELSDDVPRATRGLVNLVRVGAAHARATATSNQQVSLFEGTLAARTLDGEDLAFAQQLIEQQEAVLDVFLDSDHSLSVELIAELGLSIDTLTRLKRWVSTLDDWQLESIAGVLHGPLINFKQLRYVIGPVLKHMAELEGRRLTGWYTETVVDWCQGKPFPQIPRTDREERLEDLIGLMYSEIQHILPWGLYAADRFLADEASRRELTYGNEVNQLAYLVDAGVPSWPALRLTTLGFERTDAARLSDAYIRSRAASETDVVRWLAAQSDDRLAAIVRGTDRRRLDYDFEGLLREIRGGGSDTDRGKPNDSPG